MSILFSPSLTLQEFYPFSPFSPDRWREGVEWAAKDGFHGVELAVCRPREVDADELNRLTGQYNLRVSTLATGQAFGLEGLSLTHPDKAVRKAAADRIIAHLELAAKIGNPKVTVGSLRGTGDTPDSEILLSESLKPCVEAAARLGGTINLEPMNRGETSLLNTCAQGLAFLEAHFPDTPQIGLLLDSYHCQLEGTDPAEDARLAAKRLTHVHFADTGRLLPGDGSIDFSSLWQALLEVRYRGFVSLEVKPLPDFDTFIATAGDRLRSLCPNP